MEREKNEVPGPVAILPVVEPIFVDAVHAAGGTVAGLSAETRGLIWLSYDRAGELAGILQGNPQITWVQLPWAGVDAFAESLRTEARPNLLWTSAKGAYSEPVAEHALALTLALLRLLPARIKATEWDPVPAGTSLFGRNVVVVGAGGIAHALVRMLSVFDARITVVRRVSRPFRGVDQTVTSDRLDDVLPDADVVILAAALTGRTHHLIGSSQFALMKPTAYLVNIGRGALVDTESLVRALFSGTIAGAGLDVTDPEPLPPGHPLWSAPNVVITPHTTDTPDMSAPLLAARITANAAAFFHGGSFIGIVDPEVGY
jgi:phosphoglycerate dehydrogenase-like enzyme